MAARPDRPAVKDLVRDLTYGELREEVAGHAAGLAGRGVVHGDRIALHLPNSVDFVVAALACQSVGAVFVPLAVTDPASRLATILEDLQPALVITGASGDLEATVPDGLARYGWFTMSQLAGTPPAPNDRRAPGHGDQVAYAIYTSGTTGTPKGVLIGEEAFGAAVRATIDALGLGPDTRTLCVSPFHFDGSFATLFPTLAVGGAVVVLPRDSLLFARTFFKAVAREAITYTGFSPSYLRLLLSSRDLPTLAGTALRVVALGGEASTAADVQSLWVAAPGVRVFNRYGPTETTIAVTHLELTPELLAGGTVPLGQPHPGVTFHLVDEHGALVHGTDAVGELYIGGPQLMSGYWRGPELTAAVLRTDVVPGSTLYKTGDLVSVDPRGNYVYFDRADRVVKRSGVRISLVEVAEVLSGLEPVVEAVCALFDNQGTLGIAAFAVVAGATSAADVQRAARERLPSTMLPDRIEIVGDMPLTAVGKIDERRLLSAAGLAPNPIPLNALAPPGASG
jgi:D-alanine--poly(phosphoribitol) ligase subunit 1